MISAHDKIRIEAAIAAAEAATSGEIFCVIAHECGDYRLFALVWAAGAALLVPLVLLAVSALPAATMYLAQILVFLAVALALSWPPLCMRAVPRRYRHDRAHGQAMRQFFAQGIDATEHRTGVLIFASVAERYVEVIADSGIHACVAGGVWDDAVAVLVGAIKDGRPGDGFVGAIGRCGAVLAEHFPPGALKRNELANRIVQI